LNKLFREVIQYKKSLVFMNNLYHKVAVASVCIALGFGLGANKEAKAATLSLEPTITFSVLDFDGSLTVYGGSTLFDGLGDQLRKGDFHYLVKGLYGEGAGFAEFNIGSFSVAPNSFINSAIFQVEIFTLIAPSFGVEDTSPSSLGIFGYVGNGTAEQSDFEAGVLLSSLDVSSSSPGDILKFDVTPFVNQRVSNGDTFAGFGIRALDFGGLQLNNSIPPKLIIETAKIAEPVPEPTTIFGSALTLGVVGWLKRKKSNPQSKTTPQH
jgi:hypothetical protein